jgi:excisionase family DNA binding protein
MMGILYPLDRGAYLTMPERTKVLTTFQAADYCNVSPFTIRNWVESGKLPAYKTPGGHRRIRKDDLDGFLKKYKMPASELDEEQRKKILVVDDDETVARFLSKVVKDVDNESDVAIALDGFEAGALMTSFEPQVVILDLRMPGLDGFEVCKKIKENSNTSAAIVIGITGYYSPEAAEKFARCGGWQLLTKPIDVVKLKQVIGGAFRIYWASRAGNKA